MSRIGDYRAVVGEAAFEDSVKGSRFVGIAMGCRDEGELSGNLARVRREHPGATHRCYAALYGGRERSSDDGEPSGTAGRPIMAVLKGAGLSDSMVVVVRYFGGTLLGTGGLARAYSAAASGALGASRTAEMRACAVFSFSLGYDMLGAFEAAARDLMARPPERAFADRVGMKVWVPLARAEELPRRVGALTGGRTVPARLPDEHVPTEESSMRW